MNDLL